MIFQIELSKFIYLLWFNIMFKIDKYLGTIWKWIGRVVTDEQINIMNICK